MRGFRKNVTILGPTSFWDSCTIRTLLSGRAEGATNRCKITQGSPELDFTSEHDICAISIQNLPSKHFPWLETVR